MSIDYLDSANNAIVAFRVESTTASRDLPNVDTHRLIYGYTC